MPDLTRLDHRLDVEARTCLAVVESSRGERNKFAYDPSSDAFELKRLLPAGMSFPLDFGFVPSTRAEDGDPLDVMVMHDTPVPMGVVLSIRLVAVIDAAQTEDGETVRNDRVIGVAATSLQFAKISDVGDIGADFIETLNEFWTHYERLRGVGFKVIGVHGAGEAADRVKSSSVRR